MTLVVIDEHVMLNTSDMTRVWRNDGYTVIVTGDSEEYLGRRWDYKDYSRTLWRRIEVAAKASLEPTP